MLSFLFSETAANAFADLKAMNSAVMAEYTKVGYCMYVCIYLYGKYARFCNDINIFLCIRRSEWMMYVCMYVCVQAV
jgi:hypothetical protein